MSKITIHCTYCGKTFYDTYETMDKWNYRCQDCRAGAKPQAIVHEEGGEEEEE